MTQRRRGSTGPSQVMLLRELLDERFAHYGELASRDRADVIAHINRNKDAAEARDAAIEAKLTPIATAFAEAGAYRKVGLFMWGGVTVLLGGLAGALSKTLVEWWFK